jgi:RNA polymerase sigma-70 factor (ECF subfamily)
MIAFDAIYEKFCKRIYAFIIRYVKSDADAEEIIQEVFLKIWENKDKIDVYSSFESYIFTISYNSTISLLRKRVSEKKYIEHLKALQTTENVFEITDEVYYNELNSQIQSLLSELTPRQKEIFLLSREIGLTHDEIAKKLGISPNTVKNHIVTTLSFLRSKIDNDIIINVFFAYLFL